MQPNRQPRPSDSPLCGGDPQARAELGPIATHLAGGFVDQATAQFGTAERARLVVALLDGLILDELVRGTLSHDERRRRLDAVAKTVGIAD